MDAVVNAALKTDPSNSVLCVLCRVAVLAPMRQPLPVKLACRFGSGS